VRACVRVCVCAVHFATLAVFETQRNLEECHLGEMLRRVALVRTDISDGRIASIISLTRFGELGTILAVTNNRCTLIRNTVSLVILMMEAIRCTETSFLTRGTWCHIPEYVIVHSHRRARSISSIKLVAIGEAKELSALLRSPSYVPVASHVHLVRRGPRISCSARVTRPGLPGHGISDVTAAPVHRSVLQLVTFVSHLAEQART
jgi:hypothetical protein